MVRASFLLEQGVERVPGVLYGGPPCPERLWVSKKVFFAVDVLDGEQVRMGRWRWDWQRQRKMRGETLQLCRLFSDGRHLARRVQGLRSYLFIYLPY